jgi:transcriptional regulator with XRE-family HTH domain
VALPISEVRGLVECVCARQDVFAACTRRDLGMIIRILKAHGVTQGQIAELTGIGQGRLSEWAGGKRVPKASSTFEAFAEGLGLPSAARQALGLAPGPPGTSGPNPARSLQGRAVVPAEIPPDRVRPSSPGATRVAVDGLADLRGLDSVQARLADVLAILEAEQDRRKAGSAVRRRAWKNLVFTGGHGSGKSRTAAAVGQAYRELGFLQTGHVLRSPLSIWQVVTPRRQESWWLRRCGLPPAASC